MGGPRPGATSREESVFCPSVPVVLTNNTAETPFLYKAVFCGSGWIQVSRGGTLHPRAQEWVVGMVSTGCLASRTLEGHPQSLQGPCPPSPPRGTPENLSRNLTGQEPGVGGGLATWEGQAPGHNMPMDVGPGPAVCLPSRGRCMPTVPANPPALPGV